MNQPELITKYLQGLNKGLANSLIIISKAGTGKSETTITALKEMGLKEGINYRYYTNYVSPVELFNLLNDINHLQPPKLLVLDDLEDTLKNSRAVGLLRGALWEVNGQRKVNWLSNTYLVKNKEFNFEGKIVFLLNQMSSHSPIINALKDRSLVLDLNMSQEEMFALMEKRAEQPYHEIPLNKRKEIVSYIRKVGGNSDKISLRTLPKVYNLFLLSPQHWQILAEKIIV